MRFRDQIASQELWPQYEEQLRLMARYLDDWVNVLFEVFQLAQQQAAPHQRLWDGTVLVAVLAEKGSAQPTGPALRSAFEAMLGAEYILQADSERRGLAYQVAHVHKRLKQYRRYDPDHQAGKELRGRVKDDPLAEVFDHAPADLAARAAKLEPVLTKPEYVSIKAEWQALRKRKGGDPSWFSLFGGPPDVQRLAEHLQRGAMYELLYRPWSDTVHASNGFENVGLTDEGHAVFRPIRHPDGLQQAVSLAGSLSFATASLLLAAYAPDEQARFRSVYLTHLRSRHLELVSGKEIIIAPWK
jgi:Family of unknown function (DUF5677)